MNQTEKRPDRSEQARRTYQRDLMARRRVRAIQEGICSRCTARPVLAGLRSCKECLKNRRAGG